MNVVRRAATQWVVVVSFLLLLLPSWWSSSQPPPGTTTASALRLPLVAFQTTPPSSSSSGGDFLTRRPRRPDRSPPTTNPLSKPAQDHDALSMWKGRNKGSSSSKATEPPPRPIVDPILAELRDELMVIERALREMEHPLFFRQQTRDELLLKRLVAAEHAKAEAATQKQQQKKKKQNPRRTQKPSWGLSWTPSSRKQQQQEEEEEEEEDEPPPPPPTAKPRNRRRTRRTYVSKYKLKLWPEPPQEPPPLETLRVANLQSRSMVWQDLAQFWQDLNRMLAELELYFRESSATGRRRGSSSSSTSLALERANIHLTLEIYKRARRSIGRLLEIQRQLGTSERQSEQLVPVPDAVEVARFLDRTTQSLGSAIAVAAETERSCAVAAADVVKVLNDAAEQIDPQDVARFVEVTRGNLTKAAQFVAHTTGNLSRAVVHTTDNLSKVLVQTARAIEDTVDKVDEVAASLEEPTKKLVDQVKELRAMGYAKSGRNTDRNHKKRPVKGSVWTWEDPLAEYNDDDDDYDEENDFAQSSSLGPNSWSDVAEWMEENEKKRGAGQPTSLSDTMSDTLGAFYADQEAPSPIYNPSDTLNTDEDSDLYDTTLYDNGLYDNDLYDNDLGDNSLYDNSLYDNDLGDNNPNDNYLYDNGLGDDNLYSNDLGDNELYDNDLDDNDLYDNDVGDNELYDNNLDDNNLGENSLYDNDLVDNELYDNDSEVYDNGNNDGQGVPFFMDEQEPFDATSSPYLYDTPFVDNVSFNNDAPESVPPPPSLDDDDIYEDEEEESFDDMYNDDPESSFDTDYDPSLEEGQDNINAPAPFLRPMDDDEEALFNDDTESENFESMYDASSPSDQFDMDSTEAPFDDEYDEYDSSDPNSFESEADAPFVRTSSPVDPNVFDASASNMTFNSFPGALYNLGSSPPDTNAFISDSDTTFEEPDVTPYDPSADVPFTRSFATTDVDAFATGAEAPFTRDPSIPNAEPFDADSDPTDEFTSLPMPPQPLLITDEIQMNGGVPPSRNSGDRITVCVKDAMGVRNFYQIKLGTVMERLMEMHASQKDFDPDTVRYSLDGKGTIMPYDTALTLNLFEGDEISCYSNNGQSISIRVQDHFGDEISVFDIDRSAKMSVLFEMYADRKGVEIDGLRFVMSGNREIEPWSTAGELGLGGGDLVSCFNDDGLITIRIKDQIGEEAFKVKRSTKMAKLFDMYADGKGVLSESLRFMTEDGKDIEPSDTPVPLKLEQGGTIRVTNNGELIFIVVRDQGGTDSFFRIRKSTRMSKLFEMYAQMKGVRAHTLHFTLENGEDINPVHSPLILKLKDKDRVLCSLASSRNKSSRQSTSQTGSELSGVDSSRDDSRGLNEPETAPNSRLGQNEDISRYPANGAFERVQDRVAASTSNPPSMSSFVGISSFAENGTRNRSGPSPKTTEDAVQSSRIEKSRFAGINQGNSARSRNTAFPDKSDDAAEKLETLRRRVEKMREESRTRKTTLRRPGTESLDPRPKLGPTSDKNPRMRLNFQGRYDPSTGASDSAVATTRSSSSGEERSVPNDPTLFSIQDPFPNKQSGGFEGKSEVSGDGSFERVEKLDSSSSLDPLSFGPFAFQSKLRELSYDSGTVQAAPSSPLKPQENRRVDESSLSIQKTTQQPSSDYPDMFKDSLEEGADPSYPTDRLDTVKENAQMRFDKLTRKTELQRRINGVYQTTEQLEAFLPESEQPVAGESNFSDGRRDPGSTAKKNCKAPKSTTSVVSILDEQEKEDRRLQQELFSVSSSVDSESSGSTLSSSTDDSEIPSKLFDVETTTGPLSGSTDELDSLKMELEQLRREKLAMENALQQHSADIPDEMAEPASEKVYEVRHEHEDYFFSMNDPFALGPFDDSELTEIAHDLSASLRLEADTYSTSDFYHEDSPNMKSLLAVDEEMANEEEVDSGHINQLYLSSSDNGERINGMEKLNDRLAQENKQRASEFQEIVNGAKPVEKRKFWNGATKINGDAVVDPKAVPRIKSTSPVTALVSQPPLSGENIQSSLSDNKNGKRSTVDVSSSLADQGGFRTVQHRGAASPLGPYSVGPFAVSQLDANAREVSNIKMSQQESPRRNENKSEQRDMSDESDVAFFSGLSLIGPVPVSNHNGYEEDLPENDPLRQESPTVEIKEHDSSCLLNTDASENDQPSRSNDVDSRASSPLGPYSLGPFAVSERDENTRAVSELQRSFEEFHAVNSKRNGYSYTDDESSLSSVEEEKGNSSSGGPGDEMASDFEVSTHPSPLSDATEPQLQVNGKEEEFLAGNTDEPESSCTEQTSPLSVEGESTEKSVADQDRPTLLNEPSTDVNAETEPDDSAFELPSDHLPEQRGTSVSSLPSEEDTADNASDTPSPVEDDSDADARLGALEKLVEQMLREKLEHED